MKLRRAKWEPTKNSAIFSVHFKPDDFERKFTSLPGQTKPMQPRLKKEKLEVMAFPSVQAIGRVGDHPCSRTCLVHVSRMPNLQFFFSFTPVLS